LKGELGMPGEKGYPGLRGDDGFMGMLGKDLKYYGYSRKFFRTEIH
jgi:hypothetical protein